LELAGVHLGDVPDTSLYNRKGNKENKALRKINDDVLAFSGGSWDDLPETIKWNADLEARRDALIAGFKDMPHWGFKAPRCLATLPFWREALGDMEFVATVRHPALVAHSLSSRPGLAPKTPPLQLWIDYNQRLLHLCETEMVRLVSFDWPEEHYLEAMEQVNSSLDLPATTGQAPFFESDLRSAGPDWPPAPEVLKEQAETLYQALLSHTLAKPAIAKRMQPEPKPPRLSIVVIFHKMEREAKRTLFAFSDAFQQGVDASHYEVIAVENGTQTLDPDWVKGHGPNFRYHFHETTSPSPAAAVNVGAAMARGAFLALIVDGARIPSPGLVASTLAASRAFRPCFVSALAWHLGPDVQAKSQKAGYDQAAEDTLLDSIDWKANGYRMFDIAAQAPSSRDGILNGLPYECSWLALPKSRFDRLGGYDEAFQSPGGGLMNHDFLRRLSALPNLSPVQLLGEGTFHQIHGGATTGETGTAPVMPVFRAEYRRLRGAEFSRIELRDPYYLGKIPPNARRFVNNDPS
jgi:hypothetical protein